MSTIITLMYHYNKLLDIVKPVIILKVRRSISSSETDVFIQELKKH
jgi:hypothetical protein